MQPINPTNRFEALDITRGLAVLGILLMNIWSFGWPKEIFDYPTILSHLDGASLETWAFMHTLFEGSQRAVFSILFGAGMLMILRHLEQTNSSAQIKKIYRRRIFFSSYLALLTRIFLCGLPIFFLYMGYVVF